MKKYLFTIFILLLTPCWATLQTRGVGVTPAEIYLREESPVSFLLTVKNFSPDKEWVEVSFSSELSSFSSADPGRFPLSGGASRKVLLVFDGVEESGSVRVSASRFSSEGMSTGTGVEIPVFPNSTSVPKKGFFGQTGRASMISFLSGESYFLFTVVLLLLLVFFFRFSGIMEKKKRASLFLLLFSVFILGTGFGIFFFKEQDDHYLKSEEHLIVPSEISVDLIIDYGDGDLQHFTDEVMWRGGTVFDLLLSMERRYGISVETRDFPGVGVFIEGIHGVRNTNSSYWQYWVNGEYAQKGADNYILEDGDAVLWKRM